MRVTPAFLAAAGLLTVPVPMPNPTMCAVGGDDELPLPTGDEHSRQLIRSLLVQRSVQTQLQLFGEFKNEFARSWLVDFSTSQGTATLAAKQGSKRLLHCHTAMRNVGWDEFLKSMQDAPEETRVVSVGARPRGGSANNPFLPPPEPAYTYTDTVQPAQVARQILRIREEVAAEWTIDLGLIEKDNVELRRHHVEEVKHLVDSDENYQYVIKPCDYDDVSEEGGDASPLRQSSYDLLKNAATAEALRVLIEQYGKDPAARSTHGWLKGFSAEHATPLLGAPDHVSLKSTKSVEWQAAREVLLTMMAEPVSMGLSSSGEVRFLDPLSLAEEVMTLRAAITKEWIGICKQVPDEHLMLARQRLEQRNLFPDEAEGKVEPTKLSKLTDKRKLARMTRRQKMQEKKKIFQQKKKNLGA